jgi:hypothetical protein
MSKPAPDDCAGAYHAIDTKNIELAPPIGPKERTHMPLSAVAHWIASEGGAISITADEKWWRPAFEKLLAAIVSNRLEVGIGTARARGMDTPAGAVVRRRSAVAVQA